MKYLANAFSLQMINENVTVKIQEVSKDVFRCRSIDAISCIGHPDTAKIVSNLLDRDIKCQRKNISLNKGDILYVAQLSGGRLPEGASRLPSGYSFKWMIITIG